MPQLGKVLEQRKEKKFVKRNYRPWDLNGSDSTPETVNADSEAQRDIITDNNSDTLSDNKTTITKQTDNNPQHINKETDNKKQQNSNLSANKIKQEEHVETNKQITQTITTDSDNKTIGNHLDNETDNTTAYRSDNNLLMINLRNLSGTQDQIFSFILDVCCSLNALETGPILTHDLAIAANCSYGSAKMAIKRLIDKGLLLRKPGRATRGGYINLALTNDLKINALKIRQDKERTKLITQDIINKQKHKLLDNRNYNESDNNAGNNPNHFSSISSNNKNITTTELDEDWQKIDFEPLQKIGFSIVQIKQLARLGNKIDPKVVQESIYHFAYGLENNSQLAKYKDPLNVFMGVLREGEAWFESKYESPKEIALKKLIEFKKQEKDKLDKIINELVELDYPQWRKNLTEEEVTKIIPIHVKENDYTGAFSDEYLKKYFKENVVLPNYEKSKSV